MDVRCKIGRIEMYLLNSFQWPPYPSVTWQASMVTMYIQHTYIQWHPIGTKIKIKHDLVAPACNNCYED